MKITEFFLHDTWNICRRKFSILFYLFYDTLLLLFSVSCLNILDSIISNGLVYNVTKHKEFEAQSSLQEK